MKIFVIFYLVNYLKFFLGLSGDKILNVKQVKSREAYPEACGQANSMELCEKIVDSFHSLTVFTKS